MERIINQEERIKRAAEIYSRRMDTYNRDNTNMYYKEGKHLKKESSIKKRIIKKMLIQILICIIVYGTFVISNNYYKIFPDEISAKIHNFISYDLNFGEIYNQIGGFFNNINNDLKNITNNSINNENENNTENIENNISGEENSNTEENSAMGGAEVTTEEAATKTQEEIDIDYLKDNFHFIWPLKGTITSKYGTRTPTNIVTENHYGIDIAGNIGNDIVSSINGTVTLVSEEGDFGKHIEVTNQNVITLYAHCSSICKSVGEAVSQGEKIAEVGSTGRSTGPHLHFQIEVDDRTVNPENILDNN